ncbi:MAG: hypothetical protein ACI9CP_001836 [Cryomorphaceae bacterium]|jgi:hypothetical protein
MPNVKSFMSLAMMSFIFMTACSQNEGVDDQIEATPDEPQLAESSYNELHPYGGWYCPDNLRGFPPIDIQDLDKIAVVADRLPTQEETRNGTSLMYFDTTEIPSARPLEMNLPRVARIHSSHNDMNELITVIQAVVAGSDTVVGFRYPNGGNGTAWYGEVTFLSDEEVEEIGPSPFVHEQLDLSASKAEIWKAFTTTTYAKEIAEKFGEEAFFKSDWTDESQVHLVYESDGVVASGIVATIWGTLYMHIDYDYNGFIFSEKWMAMEQEDGTVELHVVMGPYPDDYGLQAAVWKTWIQGMKESSEQE